MNVKRISMPEGYEFKELFDFYEDVAKLGGFEPTEDSRINPRKIQISQQLFDEFMPAYIKELESYAEKDEVKNDPEASDFLMAMGADVKQVANMCWLQWGPGVRDTLTGRSVLITDGFIDDLPIPEDLGYNPADWNPVTT